MPENNHQNQPEQQLIIAIQQGNRQALDIFYDKYAPIFLGIIRRIVTDEKIADDVLLESFVVIWNRIKDYNIVNGHFFIWVTGIVRAIALERSKGLFTPAVVAVSKEISKEKTAISNLLAVPEASSKSHVLDLVVFKGYCYSEVAQELGLLSESVKNKVRLEFKELRVK